MADVSIEKLASDIGTTVDRLVGQFKDAGITKNAGDQVNEDEKQKLLDHLSKQHGSATEPTRNEAAAAEYACIKVLKNPKKVKVEVRKKHFYTLSVAMLKNSSVKRKKRRSVLKKKHV